MSYNCKIILDSESPHGDRLTTFEITYPRLVHSELMTHRMFSRNSASSRAIPIRKVIEQVLIDPVMFVKWGRNQKGMQSGNELSGGPLIEAKIEWLHARDLMVQQAEKLIAIGLHKQNVNRLLEPWMWVTVIVTATDWSNFFALRYHRDAQPELARIAGMMLRAYKNSWPTLINYGQWHLPYVPDREELLKKYSIQELVQISTGRCARVSYLTHSGASDPEADLALYHRLISNGHASPSEHPARALPTSEWCGNFRGFRQHRKDIPDEADFSKKFPIVLDDMLDAELGIDD